MPTLVQSAHNVGTGTTITVTLGAAATLTNCLVAALGGVAGAAPSISTVTVGGSADHFALARKQAVASFADGDCEVWTDQNIGVSSTSVVGTFSASQTDNYGYVLEWSGIAASAAVDKTNSGPTTASPSSSGSTGILTNPNEVIVGASLAASAGGTISQAGPGAPWNNLTQITNGSGGLIVGSQIVTATTAQTYSATITGGNGVFNSAAVIITLKETAAAAPALVTVPVAKGGQAARPGRSSVARAPAAPATAPSIPGPRRPPSAAQTGRSAVARPARAAAAGPPRTPAARGPGGAARPGRSAVVRGLAHTVTPPPVIPGPQLVNPDILKPWRKRPWPRVPLSLDLDFPATTPLDESGRQSGEDTQARAHGLQGQQTPGLRVQAEAIVTGLTRRAARTIDTGNVLDADLAESLLYWQQYRNRRKK